MDQQRIERAARFMFDGHRTGARFESVPEADRPRDLDEAYAAQDRFLELSAGGEAPRLAGYKIAVTSKVIQDLVGLGHPCLGGIRAGTVHDSPAQLSAADFQHPSIECEIAFRLGRDLASAAAPYDRDSVAAAVESCHPAFEIIEDRGADYGRMEAMSLIADNCWCGGVVLGPGTADWRGRGIGELGGRLDFNGTPAGEGVTRDALGHPLEGLAWIANTLAARGRGLAAGMVVITGSIIATRPLAAGDRAVYTVDGLGTAELTMT